MSGLNLGLSFYIIEMDEETYSLYNAKTDKNILFGVERDLIDSFLNLNEPSHPFMRGSEQELSLMFEPSCDSEYNYLMKDSLKFEYSVYDPFYADTDGLQLNFSFMDQELNKPEEKVTERPKIEKEDNIFPFLPRDDE